MAQRRMFSLKVIDTDNFLDMSPTAQNLYFHLGMRADDDGFVASPKKIMQMCGAPDDDMKVLIAKGFVIPMSTSGVCIITHWKVNNLIRPDRYAETEYKEEKGRLDCKDNKYFISTGPGVKHIGIQNVIPNGNQRVTQDRLGKVRKEEETTNSSFKKKTKRFFQGREMRFAQNKWWVMPGDGGDWLEFDMRFFKDTVEK